MRKQQELTDPNSCMSKALDSEMTFVLLGRDVAAPGTIRAWVAERLSLGKNAITDPQIIEALACANTMEREQKSGIQINRCTPSNPMPKGAPGRWEHVRATDDGECSQGCCDYWKCPDCGHTWKTEVGQ